MRSLFIIVIVLLGSFSWGQVEEKTPCNELDTLLKQVVLHWKKGETSLRDKAIVKANEYKYLCSDTVLVNKFVSYNVLINIEKNNFDSCFKSLKNYNYSLNCSSNVDSLNTFSFFSLKSTIYINMEDNKEAMQNIELALKYLNANKYPKKYVTSNYKRANILRTYNKHEEAIELYQNNIRLLEDEYAKLINYQALCATFKELNNFDSANFYSQKALAFYEKTDNEFSSYYVRLLMFEFKLDRFLNNGINSFTNEEVTILEKAAKAYTERGEAQLEINAKSRLGEYFLKVEKDRLKGLLYLEDAFKLASDSEYEAELLVTSKALLEDQMNQIGDKNNYAKVFLESVKSRYNKENTKAIIDIQEKLNVKEKDELILRTEKEAAENALIATRNLSYFLYAIFGAILLIVLGGGFYYWKQQKNAKKIDELNKKALQLQMNPHFFFNVLNSINSFIVKNDKKEAQQYLSKFSRLMRLTLENAQENLIPIEKEIELVENYLALEQLRTKNFNYTIDVDESIKDKKIPPLMIQPFVENSIVHAFRDMDRQGEIEVSLKQINDTITIKISDDGKGIDTSVTKINPEKSSLALKITRERLNAMFKHKEEIIFDTLRLDNKDYPGTLVKFRIPVIS